MYRRQGCLSGLLQMFLLTNAYEWMQRNFGFGRGASCAGCGCGIILFVLFVIFACSIIMSTDWFRMALAGLLGLV